MRLFIFGAGYSGRAIARELAPKAEWAGGTTRDAGKFGALEDLGLQPFAFDGHRLGRNAAESLAGATHLIQSIAPDEEGDPLLRALKGRLADAAPKLRWIGYLSTVGVYGDHGGAQVDERSSCQPVSHRSKRRLETELAWMDAGGKLAIPTAILRLAGIYGPGRNAFVKLRDGTARRLVKPGQVFNRIHVADIAGATAMLAGHRLGGVWNITDDEPAPPQDLIILAARLMGVEPPPEIPFDTAKLSAMARSFYGENKRVSNAKLRQAGYDLRFPNHRAALTRMWTENSWGGDNSDA